MVAIVAVDRYWGIGRQGGMLFHLPEDLAFFRETTTGNTIVMGRATLHALPGGKPLGNRLNVVLTRNEAFTVPGAVVCHSLKELLAALAHHAQGEVFVAGGEEVYRLLLPYCEAALVTKIDADGRAEKYFPDLDTLPGWQLAEQGDSRQQNGLEFSFCRYENKCPIK